MVHVTVSPTLIWSGFGEYASVVKLDEPDFISAATSAAKAGVSVDIGASTAAIAATSPTATAILEFIG